MMLKKMLTNLFKFFQHAGVGQVGCVLNKKVNGNGVISDTFYGASFSLLM